MSTYPNRGIFDKRSFELVRGKWKHGHGIKEILLVVLLVVFLLEVSLGLFLIYCNWTNQRNNHPHIRTPINPRRYNELSSEEVQASIYPVKNKYREHNVLYQEENERVDRLEGWLEDHDSPLAPYAGELIETSKNAGIRNLHKLIISISGAESGLGKVCTGYNAWGIKCDHTTFCSYGNWLEGIEAIASLLSSDTYTLGKEATEEDIQRIAGTYAESGRWPSLVTYFWHELEGG